MAYNIGVATFVCMWFSTWQWSDLPVLSRLLRICSWLVFVIAVYSHSRCKAPPICPTMKPFWDLPHIIVIPQLWHILRWHQNLLSTMIWDIRCFIHIFLTWNQHNNNLHLICSPPMTLFTQHHRLSLKSVVKALSFVALLSITIALGLIGRILSNTAHKISLNVVVLWLSW